MTWTEPVQPASAGRLGCGVIEARLVAISGRPLGTLNATTVDFYREVDTYSRCAITANTYQNSIVQQIRQWEHEIEILRDGVVVWAGPVIGYSEQAGVATITGGDISAYAQVSILDYDYAFLGVDWSLIALDLLFAQSLPNIRADSPDVFLSGINGTLEMKATQLWTAADAIRQAATFVDWTTVARKVYIDGRSPSDREIVGTVYDEHVSTTVRTWTDGFQDPDVVFIRGKEGVTGRFPPAGKERLRAPRPIGLVIDRSDLTTQSDVDAAAARSFDGFSSNLHFELGQGTRLLPNAPITFDRLIPGRLIQVTLRNERAQVLSAPMRLVKMQCRAGAGGAARDASGRFTTEANAAQEQVMITLASLDTSGQVS